ncbi:hypothetical protein [Pseudomonas huanghezhanensis]|uniref:hypothetical protein n=1 Tax=Pseudomonas huanghezhanensis TaxID=3002903 RepID=UPI002286079A|nr:hypothetical protein [Pseudomonas sp. BSw22131]
MAELCRISAEARLRYRTIQSLAYIDEIPALTPERCEACPVVVALDSDSQKILGFAAISTVIKSSFRSAARSREPVLWGIALDIILTMKKILCFGASIGCVGSVQVSLMCVVSLCIEASALMGGQVFGYGFNWEIVIAVCYAMAMVLLLSLLSPKKISRVG